MLNFKFYEPNPPVFHDECSTKKKEKKTCIQQRATQGNVEEGPVSVCAQGPIVS